MQKNIYQSESGAWNVEIRFEGDNRWINIGVFDTKAEAMRLYRKS
jgi:hypothetical protein